MKVLKSLAVALMGVILVNLAALGGVIGWLGLTGRLNQERVQRVVDVFDHTIAYDKAQQKKAKQKAEKQSEQARRAERLQRVKDGPLTLQDRLDSKQQAEQIGEHRLARLQEETDDLRQQIKRAKQRLAEQKKALDQKREAFEAFVKQRTEKMKEDDFQKAVRLYESLDADQTKRMFQQLMNQGEQQQVVRYLAAMPNRKAAAILEAFETPQEIEQATALLQKLRNRGVHPLAGQALDKANAT